MEQVIDAQVQNRLLEDEEALDAPSLSAVAADENEHGDVQVVYGASVQNFAVTGQSLSEARDVIAGILQVPPDSPALVNGEPVSHSYRLKTGDMLEFVHHAGEKGRA